MNQPLLSPILDVTFKLLFASKENEPLLRSLLAAVLGLPAADIGAIEHINTELPPQEPQGKFVRLDLCLHVGERKINIEVQKCRQSDYRERALFYWSSLYQNSLQKGDPYEELPQTICINLIDFDLFDCPDYHSIFFLMEHKRQEMLTDKLRIDFLELTKISMEQKISGQLFESEDLKLLWMKFLKAQAEGEFAMLEQAGNAEICTAVNLIRHYSADEKIRLAAVREMERQRDEENIIYQAQKEAREEGREMGREEGIEVGVERTALAMLKKGYDAASISEITDLSEQQIDELAKKAENNLIN